MPNFKPKAKKKIKMNKNTLITLDNKHNEKMTRFEELENTIIPTAANNMMNDLAMQVTR